MNPAIAKDLKGYIFWEGEAQVLPLKNSPSIPNLATLMGFVNYYCLYRRNCTEIFVDGHLTYIVCWKEDFSTGDKATTSLVYGSIPAYRNSDYCPVVGCFRTGTFVRMDMCCSVHGAFYK